jgi:hypothetical protein
VLKVYKLATRPLWKCSGCRYQFSVTAGTIFADRKRPIRDYLLAIAIFTNGAKGHAALQLSRDLNCQYKTAFVLTHKLREVIEAEQRKVTFSGTCEVDGAQRTCGERHGGLWGLLWGLCAPKAAVRCRSVRHRRTNRGALREQIGVHAQ